MPAEVIQRVHVLARSSSGGLTFTDNQNQVYDDDDDDYTPDDDDNGDEDLEPSIAGVDDEEINDIQADQENFLPDPPTEDEDKDPPPLIEREESEEEDASDDESDGEQEPENNHGEEEQDNDNDEYVPGDDNLADDLADDPVDNQKVLRALNKLKINDKTPEVIPERTRSQSRHGTTLAIYRPSDHHMALPDLEAVAMTQYNMKRGIREFGQDGVDVVWSELQHLHTRKTVKPVEAKELTCEQKKASLQYLMFLKQKKCGRIKGRGYADGRKQRATINKEDANAPTAAIKAVMLSCAIDEMEGRDVATADIPGAFMHTDMDETVHVRLEGTMAEL